jgi:hypothetical protein
LAIYIEANILALYYYCKPRTTQDYYNDIHWIPDNSLVMMISHSQDFHLMKTKLSKRLIMNSISDQMVAEMISTAVYYEPTLFSMALYE